MTVFPHDEVLDAVVVPVGDPDRSACETVSDALRDAFGIHADVVGSIAAPTPWESEDYPHLRQAIDAVQESHEDRDLAIGVTDERTVQGVDEPAFGGGIAGGSCGLISTYHLDATNQELRTERIRKETLSVAAKLFDVKTHREEDLEGDPECVLQHRNAVAGLDEAPDTYCEACWSKLTDDSSYPKPPEPPDWVVMSEDLEQVLDALRTVERGTTWRDYPWLALGYVGYWLGRGWQAIASPISGVTGVSARDMPQWVHTFYRTARFWGNLGLFFVGVLLWMGVLASAHDAVFGPEISDPVLYGIVILGLAFGVVTVWILKGIALGLYGAARGVDPEDLE